MRALPVILLLMLPGCLGSSSDGVADTTPSDVDVGSSQDEAGTLQVLNVAVEFQLNDPMPPLAFTVPANRSHLLLRYEVKSEGACESVVGEPGAGVAEGAWMHLAAPSGDGVHVGPLGGTACQAVQPRPSFAGVQELPFEAGDWQVTFGGRGIGSWLQVIVEAS